MLALFVSTALPLDKAWRCYPDPTIHETSLGRCDTETSTAHQRFHVRATKHTDFFWISLFSGIVPIFIAICMFLFQLVRFREMYSKYLFLKLNGFK